MRFLLELVARVKEEVGEEYPLCCRISFADRVPGGNTFEDTKIVARALVEAGVHILSVTAGWHDSTERQITADVPQGNYVGYARSLKAMLASPLLPLLIRIPLLTLSLISTRIGFLTLRPFEFFPAGLPRIFLLFDFTALRLPLLHFPLFMFPHLGFAPIIIFTLVPHLLPLLRWCRSRLGSDRSSIASWPNGAPGMFGGIARHGRISR